MKTYLAGPIKDCTDEQCKSWREYVKTKLPDTLDPMDRDYRGRENDNVDQIVEGDKTDINAADILLVNFPGPSAGTCMEMIYAWELGKYLVVVVPEGASISPWVRYHSHYITSSFDDAIDHIQKEVKPQCRTECLDRNELEETIALYTVVSRFNQIQKHKLLRKYAEGKRGWDDPSLLQPLKDSLAEHVRKGDMVDVANIAMFIWNIEYRTKKHELTHAGNGYD